MTKRKSTPTPGPIPGTVSRELTLGQFSWLQGRLLEDDRRRMSFQPAHEDEHGNLVPDRAIVEAELDPAITDLFVEARNQDVPSPNDLDRARADAQGRIAAYADQVGTTLKAGIPEAEVDSFYAKETAARRQVAGTPEAEDTLILQAEATITGESLGDLAQRIIGRADQFRFAAGSLAGLRRKTQSQVSEARTPVEIDQILRAAKEHANELLAGLSSSA